MRPEPFFLARPGLGILAMLWILFAFAGCRGESREGVQAEDQASALQHVILISVDTLRADHLGCYGYDRDTSPNIDRFAREAVLFETCLSHAPLTSTSCASLLSGFLPHETEVLGTVHVPPGLVTLPKIREAQGFTTLGVVSNPILKAGFGWEQGFAIYDSKMKERDKVRRHRERNAGRTTDRAIELLTEHREKRLFLWVHYQDPHGPYTPPKSYAGLFESAGGEPRPLEVNDTVSGQGGIPSYQRLGDNRDYRHYVDRYDAEIRYMDDCVGRLLDTIAELGLSESSIIVFTADHGEGMGENDYFFAHGENLHLSLLRVPLIIRFGGQGGRTRTDPVQHLDIVPTVLGSLGIDSGLPLRGADLRAGPAVAREIFAEKEKGGVMRSLLHDGFRLVYSEEDDRFRLFDLRADPGEEHDLSASAEHRERLNDLKTRMARVAGENALEDLTHEPGELTAEEAEGLRSLGYLY